MDVTCYLQIKKIISTFHVAGLLAFSLFILTTVDVVSATDFTASGYAHRDDSWRVAASYHAPSLKADWYRQTKGAGIVDGYDLMTTHVLRFAKVQYRQSYKSDRVLDTQEISGMGTFHGIGLGIARMWIGDWENPAWTGKAQYAYDTKFVSVGVDWASDFRERKLWSISQRVKIPAWKFLSFVLSGKWEKVEAGGERAEWWSVDGGVAFDITEIMETEIE